jgi:dipeptidyl aminopeptidase/acylaminoacyl peptidase
MNHLILLASLILGIDPIERGAAAFRPTAAEPDVPEPFRLAPAVFPFELQRLRDDSRFTVSALRFPSPIASPDPENNTVHAEYFRPADGAAGGKPPRRPAVIVLHILGADFALSRYLAARLADAGVAALFVKLPYYGERRPAGTPQRFLSANIDRSMGAMRQGICDVRRAAAWLAGQPEIDPARLGITGVSLGGIVAAVTAAVDPTLNRAVLLLAGGDLARILWEMPEAARYRTLWLESGRTFADLKALTDPFDPLTYAHRLVGKRLLMLSGNVDEVVPPACSRALWTAAGRPPIQWYDCGHYSAVAYLLPAARTTIAFFAADGVP